VGNQSIADLKRDLFDLVNVMNSITSEHNLDKLLRLIVDSAVHITGSDAASLYLIEGNKLKFVVTANKTLEKRWSKKTLDDQFKPFHIPISTESISGFVAETGSIVNIKDVYELKDNVPYSFNKQFDINNDYRSRSLLTLPLINREGKIIGVLQLINKLSKDGKTVGSYKKYDEEIASSLGSQAAIALDNARLTENLKKAHYDSIMRLSAANEFRDNETGFHVKRVSAYCEIIARTLGKDTTYIQNIKYASPLHDIGKIGIPDQILRKPGKLTTSEYEIMKTHANIGAQILGKPDNEIMRLAVEVAVSHHEKWDGTGYPNGLKGDKIPLSGRITAIADVFDALSNKRVYKPAFPLDKTFKIIKESCGSHFDPEIVEAFEKSTDDILEIFNTYKDED
jgi:HD-GYP domain-containing protein (c-di-GMP phosphodiesterase class II)